MFMISHCFGKTVRCGDKGDGGIIAFVSEKLKVKKTDEMKTKTSK